MSEVPETYWVPTQWRAKCPKCGRFVKFSEIWPVLDVLTYPGEDYLRDVTDHCGTRVEVEIVVTRVAAHAFIEAGP